MIFFPKPVSMSDNGHDQVLRQLALHALIFPDVPLLSRLQGSFPQKELFRMLQKVTHRKPVPFQPHPAEPTYLLVYVVETLACGHQFTIYPQVDPLITMRRNCPNCGPRLIPFPIPKKNQMSDREAA